MQRAGGSWNLPQENRPGKAGTGSTPISCDGHLCLLAVLGPSPARDIPMAVPVQGQMRCPAWLQAAEETTVGRAHPLVSYAQPRAAVPACSAACQATPCSLRYAVEWEWAGVHAWPAGPRATSQGISDSSSAAGLSTAGSECAVPAFAVDSTRVHPTSGTHKRTPSDAADRNQTPHPRCKPRLAS